MNKLTIILLFLPFAVFSQSVKVDGPTGQVSDLVEISSVDSSDLMIVERSDSSKKVTAFDFHGSFHSMGSSYLSTEGTQTIGTGGTFEKLFEGAMAYSGNHLENFTQSNGRLTYTGVNFEHFLVICNMTIHSGETAQRIQCRIAENGTSIEGSNQAIDFTATTLDLPLGLVWVVELAPNDYIEIYGTSDTNGDEFDIHNLVFTLFAH